MLTDEQKAILPESVLLAVMGADNVLADDTWEEPRSMEEFKFACRHIRDIGTQLATALLTLEDTRKVLKRKCGQMVDSGGQNPDGSWIEVWKPCEIVTELAKTLEEEE